MSNSPQADTVSKDQDTFLETAAIAGLAAEEGSSTQTHQTPSSYMHLSDSLLISAIVVVDNGVDLGPILKQVGKIPSCPSCYYWTRQFFLVCLRNVFWDSPEWAQMVVADSDLEVAVADLERKFVRSLAKVRHKRLVPMLQWEIFLLFLRMGMIAFFAH
jgi:hypothetical protein